MSAELTGRVMNPSLCENCRHMKPVITPKGSRFLLCQMSMSDERYPKYPPQPVVRCAGYEAGDEESDKQASS